MERLEAYLVLGCNGHSDDDGFVNCLGVENPILDLEIIEEAKYERLLYFFENACDLFDRPMYNYNKCSNTLNMLHRDYGVITQNMLFHIQKFTRMHRECGIHIMLVLKEDYNE